MTDDTLDFAANAFANGCYDDDRARYVAAVSWKAGYLLATQHAQKWRSMESAPHEGSVLLRNDHWVYVSHWRHSEQLWVINGSGGAIVSKPTGWLPLPPMEVK